MGKPLPLWLNRAVRRHTKYRLPRSRRGRHSRFLWLLVLVGLVVAGVMMSVGRRHRSSTAADGAVGIPWVIGGLSTIVLAVPLVNLFM